MGGPFLLYGLIYPGGWEKSKLFTWFKVNNGSSVLQAPSYGTHLGDMNMKLNILVV